MDPASFAFSALSTADVCIKLFKVLRKRYQAYTHAEAELKDSILLIEHHGIKAETQMEALKTIWESLETRLQANQLRLLQRLQGTLQNAITQADSVIGEANSAATRDSLIRKTGTIGRVKYAARIQSLLRESIEEVEKWESLFDPTWYLIARSSSASIKKSLTRNFDTPSRTSSIDNVLAGLRAAATGHREHTTVSKSIFESAPTLHTRRGNIPGSSATIAHVQGEETRVIVDSRITYGMSTRLTTDVDVRTLARSLQQSVPMTFGLLKCLGVIRTIDQDVRIGSRTFDFVFEVPPGLHEPRGLRTALVEAPRTHPLDERVRLAKLLAKSVAFVHNVGLVHKKISPDTFIAFRDGVSVLGTPFLVGFEKFRLAEGFTYRAGDEAWEANLYRHPLRQGIEPEQDYEMQHDIYSLGVCLLEIGLWRSFVDEIEEGGKRTPGPCIAAISTFDRKDPRRAAFQTKEMFTSMARELLPPEIGTKYADVVIACLTCLDEDDNHFGDQNEFLDEDGILVAVRYIERVLMRLEDISL